MGRPASRDTLEALREGQRDGSIRNDLDAEATAHAIVVEGVGSAFLWTVDPAEVSANASIRGAFAPSTRWSPRRSPTLQVKPDAL